ncbi:ComEA family DNA-binding protein [Oribacterium sp. P6A1]|uniref:ComEA family DNA-binding protein n=1 Tax=Oribacterium sp. P6A1 TaxID=1410612 RepID=UPI000691C60D|nr:helix-hairpin-helix domain-containing protein [Oribacterium sp. P6A1]
MTEKEKNKLRERLKSLKQILVIILMIISGVYYVTMGRAQNKATFKVYSETQGYKEEEKTKSSANNYNPTVIENTENKLYSKKDNDVPCTEEPQYIQKSDDTRNSDTQNKMAESEANGSHFSSLSSSYQSTLVNINKADQQELETIPGVGPATAKNIIEYREKYGGFAAVEEIKNVKRIGDKTFEKLRDHITV